MSSVLCTHVSRTYGQDGSAVRALDDVTFSLEKGELTIICGPSGSGKSTLLHILGSVDRADSGSILVNGSEITQLSPTQAALYRRRHAGIIYQFFNLIPTLNLRDNIQLPLTLDGRKPDLAQFQEIIRILQLEDVLDHYPSQVSGGQQQRAAVARCLLMEPDLILADEPTGNLDRHNAREIVDLLKSAAHRFGQTVVMVTHDESAALQADHLIRMEDGHIVLDERRKTS